MSEEQLVKDGALLFNAPDKNSRKPNVIYYNTAAETTGIEYTKQNEEDKQGKTTLFKVIVSVTGILAALSVVSLVYFIVVKLRGKSSEEPTDPKEPTDLESPPGVYGETQPVDNGVGVVLEDIPAVNTNSEDVWFIRRYFESLLSSSVQKD